MILAVDIGNTRAKVGVFKDHQLIETLNFSHQEFEAGLRDWIKSGDNEKSIQYLGGASVGNRDVYQALTRLVQELPLAKWLSIDYQTPLPVENAYASPKTLGIDRICACVGARERQTEGALLVIDAGTAITYDFLDAQNRYQGGGIAPGLRLRFRVLNDYTAALPLVDKEGDLVLIGYNTETSIRSGVVNGMLAEIEGLIEQYKKLAGPDLQVFLTGGDADFLGNHLKKVNFVDSKLLLYGIHAVIIHHFLRAQNI